MTAPVFQAVGTQANGTASVNVSWPTHLANDIGIMVIETSGDGGNLTPPSGWAAVTGTPVTSVATAAGSKLHVWWKRAASGAEPAVATGFSTSNHVVSRIYTFRGCAVGGDPWDVATTSSKTTGSTSVTIPDLVTTVPDTLVTWIVSRPDDSASTAAFNVATFAGLTGVAEAVEAGTNNGNGGGFTVQYGTEAAAGSTGTGTISGLTSTTTGLNNAIVVFALRSPRDVLAETGTFNDNGVDASLQRTYVFSADSGAFAASGQAATLVHSRVFPADLGKFFLPERNLIKYSEEFDNAAWTKVRCSISANATLSPDGLLLGDKVVEDTSNNTHILQLQNSSPALRAGQTYVFSWYLKAGERTVLNIAFGTDVGTFNDQSFDVNLSTGVISNVSPTGFVSTPASSSAGNGWYRISAVVVANSSTLPVVRGRPVVGGSQSYQGDGTSGYFIWGAQLEEGSTLTDYDPTGPSAANRVDTRKGYYILGSAGNFSLTGKDASLGISSQFSANAGNFAVTGNAAGVYKNFKISANTGVYTFTGQSAGFQGQRYLPLAKGTFSITGVTASTRKNFRLLASAGSFSLTGNAAVTKKEFLVLGSAGSFTVTGNANTFRRFYVVISNTGAIAITGNAAVTKKGFYAVADSSKFFVPERNRLRWSESLSSIPWNLFNATITSDVAISPDGTLTADRYSVTSSATLGYTYQLFAVEPGGTYTGSAYVKLETLTVSEYKIAVYDETNLAFIAVDVIPSQTPSTAVWTRISYTFTVPTNCTQARWYSFRNTNATAGRSVLLWGSQVEEGDTASSYDATGPAGASVTITKKGYYISGQKGTFTETGNAAVTKKGFYLLAATGSFALTGNAAGLRNTRYILGSAGSYVFTGQSAGFQGQRYLPLAKGTFTITGVAAGTRKGFNLTASVGTFTETGNAAITKKGFYVASNKGTYTFVGNAANLYHYWRILASAGTYTLTGINAVTKKAFYLSAATGTLSVTGIAAVTKRGLYVSGQKGTYAITGNAAITKKGFYLAAATGTFSATGNAASVSATRYLPLSAGTYVITGKSVGFQGQRILPLDAGSFATTGQTAALLKKFYVSAESYKVFIPERNLITQSEQLAAPGWESNNTSIISDAIIAPDGTLTADKIIVSNGTGLMVRRRTSGLVYKVGQSYVASVYLKAAEMTTAAVFFDTTCVNPDYYGSGWIVNLTTGSTSGSLQSVSVGDGWYRVWLTVPGDVCGAISVNLGVSIVPGSTGNVNSVTGNGVDGIYAWGAQVEEGTTPSAYDGTSAAKAAITVTRKGFYLSAATGSFSETGRAANLYHDWRILGNTGTFAATGNDAVLRFGHYISGSAGSFSIAGQNAITKKSFYISSSKGAYTITGNSAIPKKGFYVSGQAANFTVTANAAVIKKGFYTLGAKGTFNIAGNAAVTKKGFYIAAPVTSYTYSGNAASVKASRYFSIATGTFVFTGNSIGFNGARYLPIYKGDFLVSGGNATTAKGFYLSGQAGNYAITGNSAVTKKGFYTLASGGTYSYEGFQANLLKGFYSYALAGLLLVEGTDSTLAKGFYLEGISASYGVTGIAASLGLGGAILATPGAFELAGQPAVPRKGFHLDPGAGYVDFIGNDANFDVKVPGETGQFDVTGNDSIFIYDYVITANKGSVVITTVSAGLGNQRYIDADPGTCSVTPRTAKTLKGLRVITTGAVFSITGKDAKLTKDIPLYATKGSTTVTGNPAGLYFDHRLVVSNGNIAVNGQQATLKKGFKIEALGESYSYFGLDSNIYKGFKVLSDKGQFAVNGNIAALLTEERRRVVIF